LTGYSFGNVTPGVHYHSSMNKNLGKIGKIIGQDSISVKVRFDNNVCFYPISVAQHHITTEKEYQKSKLIETMKDRIVTKKRDSSVDFLINAITIDRMFKAFTPSQWNEVYKRAEQLHQEEIEEAFCHGDVCGELPKDELYEYAKEYYNDNYNKK
jgi:hypothetical protein